MPDPIVESPPAPPVPSDRCQRHDFPLDSNGCALCRQESAQAAYNPSAQAPLSATIPRKHGDPAVWIIGSALTFAGCIVPLGTGVVSGLLAFLIFDTGLRLTLGIGLGISLLTFFGVFASR